MQKKIIALAVAGLASTAAFADTNVQIYGILDVGVGHSQNSYNQSSLSPGGSNPIANPSDKFANTGVTGMFNGGMSPSRIGLKGSEDLGNGLKAVFKLETGVNPQSGSLMNGPGSLAQNGGINTAAGFGGAQVAGDSSISGQLFNREAYVGLSSQSWGTVVFGRNNSLLLDAAGAYDPLNGSYMFSPLGYSGVFGGGGFTQDARLDSSVKYNVGFGNGLSLGALYKFGGQQAGTSAQSATQLSLAYDNGPLGLVGGYSKNKDALSVATGGTFNTLTATAADTTAWMLAAKYALGTVTLKGGYERLTYANPSNSSADLLINNVAGYQLVANGATAAMNVHAYDNEKRVNAFWGGANWDVSSQVQLSAAYYRANSNTYGAAATQQSGHTAYTSLLADYKFSKRTDAYAGYMHTSVSDGNAAAFAAGASTSNNFYGVGMRHSF